jgi:hypothetical protein
MEFTAENAECAEKRDELGPVMRWNYQQLQLENKG